MPLLRKDAGFIGKCGGLVVQRDDAGRSQHRLAQPAHAEQQQQYADRDLQPCQRDQAEAGSKHGDENRQQRQRRTGTGKGRPPSPHDPDSQNDRQGFDAFDRRSQK